MKNIKEGDFVLIKKGSVVKSYNPSKKEYVLGREQWIKVSDFFEYEWADRGSEVRWAGTGGYFCWTKLENVVEVF